MTRMAVLTITIVMGLSTAGCFGSRYDRDYDRSSYRAGSYDRDSNAPTKERPGNKALRSAAEPY
jgi:hypothetical protein